MKHQTKTLIFTALFAALACVATIMITIPSPTGGFVHLGDGIALLGGWLLGPLFGGVAAALGGMLADIFSGYAIYAPATFLIKGGVAVIAYFMYKLMKKHHMVALLLSGIFGELFMVCGYFIYDATVCGYGLGALAGVVPNIAQGVMGVISGVILLEVMNKTKLARKIGIKKGILDHDREH